MNVVVGDCQVRFIVIPLVGVDYVIVDMVVGCWVTRYLIGDCNLTVPLIGVITLLVITVTALIRCIPGMR